MNRTCLDCGTLTQRRYRCYPCDLARQRARNQARPQYHGPWQRISKTARQAEPWCHRPGCPDPHTTDLTLDHETGTVECRPCNSSHRRNH